MIVNLLAGSLLVAVTVCVHGIGLLTMSWLLRRTVERHRPQRALSGTVVVMVATVLGLFALHTIEVWMWGIALILTGAVPDLTDALTYSTLSFSTLGAATASIAPQWELFGSIE